MSVLPVFAAELNAQLEPLISNLPFLNVWVAVGAICILVVGIGLFFGLLRGVGKASDSIARASALAAMKKDETPGNKVLMANFSGRASGKTSKTVTDALETYLPEFNFGSGFYLGSAPVEITSTDFALAKADHSLLKATFEKSGADLIIWGEGSGSTKTTQICLSTPSLLAEKQSQGFFALNVEGHPSNWSAETHRAIAYVAGKRLRPSLGRPEDFRAERLQPIVQSMGMLLESEHGLTGRALIELEDDYAAGALHVGAELNDADWLQKSADYRAKTLEVLTPKDEPLRWAQAKIELGRAMCLLCEHKFDPMKLQEAMTHLREAVDLSKNDERMKLAETGFTALNRAEELLASRRRFSIRWSV